MSVSLKAILADEYRNLLSLRTRNKFVIIWRHIKIIVPLRYTYISGNFDPTQGVRLFSESARRIGLITLMKYQNLE